jgi:hypothetical protein
MFPNKLSAATKIRCSSIWLTDELKFLQLLNLLELLAFFTHEQIFYLQGVPHWHIEQCSGNYDIYIESLKKDNTFRLTSHEESHMYKILVNLFSSFLKAVFISGPYLLYT